ncbi:MAG: GNAT family N-acetyltransferase [Hyphomonas sp.]|uniref:GNAT family N-acetyltransferase n=1 Tax=Hyphomonas sp. TaxID=87 RepID=UPI00178D2239|nr:GNAT family N-acetyltransferase [Hyphomonas sp.]MBU3919627.1 GNAT family N-acetyltransferase [Alphaproteobacteria bacterium]MBA3068404.1 GNAT family N-acetyltransferase [Hyphomonas sp.]MBU4060728.1 GNAT family N-acetyltransferase [Alphaproteobacteria bacterium]MBU4164712.1 GNAT family N-acetyltransferase [Alphaproteobacteria bacterium]MBU4568008.1 GNAT family N-acetyltransferase [Alphaproteobacteria bacterium]
MLEIRPDDLSNPEMADLIGVHARTMLAASPPESCHFLPIDGLRQPSVTVWSLWDDGALAGCGALKDLGDGTGEIKSMHTREARRGSGLGRRMLEHILAEARRRGYAALFLETGSMDAFIPARRLYEAYGFAERGPFGDYIDDPHSLFMALALR